jgi:hypothetical protein
MKLSIPVLLRFSGRFGTDCVVEISSPGIEYAPRILRAIVN